ncbi:MAG: oligosaccharide flippase family protein [Prevotella sp.]|nr:oligosaccharide flippase family protein [Prevotella sp.]
MKEERDDSYGHVLKYTSIFGGVQGLNILIGLVRNKVVALLLGPSGMGLASLFQTTVNFISQTTNLGISFSAVRNVSELFDTGDAERVNHFVKVVRAWALLTGLVGMLLCILVGPLLSSLTFSWGDHTLHFVLLSPLVALLAVTGGETAILKGARRLRSLAAIQVYNVLIALVVTIPIYYFFGQSGIVPVMVLMGLAALLLTVRCSYRLYPLQLTGAKGVLGEGMGMVRLGVAFTLAGVLGSGADFVIRSYLNNIAGLEIVGLYNTGYMMTMTYAGLIFTAMETDFFPRLSAVNTDWGSCNEIVNKQIEVSLLLLSPMLVAAQFAVPYVIPILFSSKFLPVVDMMRILFLALYLRAVKLPIAYLPLAKGDSLSYLFLEAVYDVAVVLLVIWGYTWWGLTGTGVAITLTAFLDYFLLVGYAYVVYHYRMTAAVVGHTLLHVSIGIVAFLLAVFAEGWQWWIGGLLVFTLCLSLTLYTLYHKVALWNKLMSKLRHRFR